ncbi:MDR family MFS transporter [Nonomuraea roseoviolacea]|uniref:EmrB/QacA subfamily drug resistance transporter n=1 Tax=Nonomuraea roseoviolacea subsp. carminata TaxID=160689 RepID=A0ABT1KCW5_9ACTN|nr:MDR family MFS transporter [Nonomuraea roseoviolacea]MCP2351805.1 EmrB/QacA subfamily drug resistance transporter [Nonomuraea roseoviolacea subsp. carminata]
MDRSLRTGVIGVMLGMITAPLDGMMLGPALPTIVRDLGGLEYFSWVATAYLICMAASTPIWGKLGDLYGRKTVYMASIVVFLLGSALSGLAQDMPQLVAFRMVQGLGAGGLMTGALALIGELVPPRHSGRLMGMFGTMMPIAFIAGPVLGGLFAERLGWRWAFFVNLPIGALALLLIGTAVRLERRRIGARIDFLGALLLTVALVALSLVASWAGTRYAWGSAPILALVVTGAAALAALLAVERRAAEPIVPLRLFADRNFTLAQVIRFLGGVGMVVAATFLPQYMQLVQNASPIASGLLILPSMLGMVAVLVGTGRLISRTGRYRIYPILGGAAVAAGMLALLILGPGTNLALASGLTLIGGMGVGLLTQSTTIITINSAEPRDMGAASGSVTLWHTMGASLGVAVLGALYTARLQGTLVESLGAEAGARIASDRLTPGALAQLPASTREAVHLAVSNGVHAMALGAAALGALAFLLAWFIREVPLRDRTPSAEPATATA